MINKINISQKYLIALFAPSILALFVLSMGYTLLYKAGEFKDIDSITEHIIEHDGRYGSALHTMSYPLKISLYNKAQPKIIAFGSSRVMQFKARSFSQSFINMGSISGPVEALKMAQFIDKSPHKPDIILMGVDFWWFNDRYIEPSLLPNHKRYIRKLSPSIDLLIKPFMWYGNNKMTINDIRNILFTPQNDIGISALTLQSGYDQFGTYYYSKQDIQSKKYKNRLRHDIKRIKAGQKIFIHASSDFISDKKWAKFNQTLEIFQKNNIKVILFIPPVAPEIAQALKESGKYLFINHLKTKLSELPLPFFDLHDPSILHGSSTDFIDGHHGKAIIYLKILRHIFNNQKENLSAYINIKKINDDIDLSYKNNNNPPLISREK